MFLANFRHFLRGSSSPGVGRAIACGYGCGNGGGGSCGGVGGDSAVQQHSMGGAGGGERRGHTQEHTQERTRECCTYPLATYPLKSARKLSSHELSLGPRWPFTQPKTPNPAMSLVAPYYCAIPRDYLSDTPLAFSQCQSITQKGVHARPLTAREREHWFLKRLTLFPATNFGRQ